MRHENSNYHGPSIVIGNSNKGGRPESSVDTTDFASMSIDKLQNSAGPLPVLAFGRADRCDEGRLSELKEG